MKDLNRDGMIVNGQDRSGTVSYSSGAAIRFYSFLSTDDKHIRLSYSYNGQPYDYRIDLNAKKSNLGVGEYYTFKCPQTGRSCKVLYLAYDCPIFKAKSAYSLPIYYPSQIKPHWEYYYDQREKYKEIKAKLERSILVKEGKRTCNARRLDMINNKIAHCNTMWRKHLPESISTGLVELGIDLDHF